ncbi:hypothetical protein X474_15075 [Dethiosulfatarculus sandiegensis]|uniref:Uncharacterized protein n=1 Tax=Dethiosulfatarculus sandiegensis TaxID=1429043 RepID=A0A0D2JBZ4_9BACT|nr:hypothetical protein X474_15075 [Dethiosulfatarculus sandiegensis]
MFKNPPLDHKGRVQICRPSPRFSAWAFFHFSPKEPNQTVKAPGNFKSAILPHHQWSRAWGHSIIFTTKHAPAIFIF